MFARCVVEWCRFPVKQLMVFDGFCWLQMILVGFRRFCCFSSYTNFTAYRRVIFSLYPWTHVIEWGHSIFLFKVKQQEKDYCCLVIEPSENKWLFPIIYSFISYNIISYTLLYVRWKFFKRNSKKTKNKKKSSHKTQSKWSIVNYLRRGVLVESIWNFFENREIIRTHGETERTEPKLGDLPVRWRESRSVK